MCRPVKGIRGNNSRDVIASSQNQDLKFRVNPVGAEPQEASQLLHFIARLNPVMMPPPILPSLNKNGRLVFIIPVMAGDRTSRSDACLKIWVQARLDTAPQFCGYRNR